jgi:hypothetical protein
VAFSPRRRLRPDRRHSRPVCHTRRSRFGLLSVCENRCRRVLRGPHGTRAQESVWRGRSPGESSKPAAAMRRRVAEAQGSHPSLRRCASPRAAARGESRVTTGDCLPLGCPAHHPQRRIACSRGRSSPGGPPAWNSGAPSSCRGVASIGRDRCDRGRFVQAGEISLCCLRRSRSTNAEGAARHADPQPCGAGRESQGSSPPRVHWAFARPALGARLRGAFAQGGLQFAYARRAARVIIRSGNVLLPTHVTAGVTVCRGVAVRMRYLPRFSWESSADLGNSRGVVRAVRSAVNACV